MKGYYIFSPGGESVTLILGGTPHVVPKDNPHYEDLIANIKADDWRAIAKTVSFSAEFTEILGAYGDVLIYAGHVVYKGQELQGFLVNSILTAVKEGLPLEPLGRFQQNVLENPDERAQRDLYEFCANGGLPITEDGHIVAYKVIRDDYLDLHTRSIDNSVGKVVEMPREACNPDPNQTCSTGLHFCSAGYLPHFGQDSGSRIVLVKVHPRDVTAFPTDYNLTKARCCRYEVIEEIDRETAADVFKGVKLYWTEPTHFVIRSEGLGFWRSKFKGYSHDRAKAWVYDAETAKASQVATDHALQLIPVVPADAYLIRRWDNDTYLTKGGEWSSSEDAGYFDIDEVTSFQLGHSVYLEEVAAVVADEVIVTKRLEVIEGELGLDWVGLTFIDRLDAIDEALRLDKDLEPLVARIDRAERQLGLS